MLFGEWIGIEVRIEAREMKTPAVFQVRDCLGRWYHSNGEKIGSRSLLDAEFIGFANELNLWKKGRNEEVI